MKSTIYVIRYSDKILFTSKNKQLLEKVANKLNLKIEILNQGVKK